MHSNEEQQLEAIKGFWNEYGKAIVAGVVLGLAGLYGFRYYQSHQQSTTETASDRYNVLLEQKTEGGDDWLTLATDFVQTNSGNYAVFAAFLAAKEAVAQQKYDVAAEQLSWVVSNVKDATVKAIAQLRLARVQREQGLYAEALNTLAQPVPASFASLQAELKGDLLLLSGEPEKAKTSYQQALISTENQQLIQIKLDELAHITAG